MGGWGRGYPAKVRKNLQDPRSFFFFLSCKEKFSYVGKDATVLVGYNNYFPYSNSCWITAKDLLVSVLWNEISYS